jgi:signal peptidase I
MESGKLEQAVSGLIKIELKQGRLLVLEVSSMSMYPFVKPRDKINIRNFCPERLALGDIIVFCRYDEIYAHRLLSKDVQGQRIRLLSKGDNSFVTDDPVLEEEYLGKVVAVKRREMFFDLETASWKFVNRCIALLSGLEAVLYQLLRRAKRFKLKN